ncbi:MAG TPA: VCBS repeat-containing protein [Verrucomicrobiae bacterium]|nr:VCBS repeat-containing protein [Verrucomicrobiae bacterium]
MKFARPIFFGFLAVLFASAVANAQQLFDSWITYSIDKAPTSVQSGDMDNDGDLDLVIGHLMGRAGQPTVLAMENDGQGFFTLRHTLYPAQRSGPVRAIDVFDLDGDGDLEILTAHDATGRVNFFRNKGGGTGFELPIECRAGRETFDVTAGFLDGDGFPELLAVNRSSGTVSIYKNRGSAAYPAESIKVVGTEPRSIELFDMDNDGDNDFAVSVGFIRPSPPDPYIGFAGFVLFENQGNGIIDDSARVLYKVARPSGTGHPLDTALNPFKILAEDFNNDGFLDLALACNAATIQPASSVVLIFLNRQNGTFDTLPALSKPARYTVGFGCQSIAAEDVDGDGDKDLISANYLGGTISVLKNNGNGTFAPKVDFLTPNNPPSVVSGGDYDGDGDFDVAAVSLGTPPSNPGNSFAVLKNKGDGTFEAGNEYLAGDLNVLGNLPFGIARGDVDGDGDIDLAIANQGIHDITIHRNSGSGSFPSPTCPPCSDWYFPPGGSKNWSGPRGIVLADLDGDLDLDFATANMGSNNVAVYKNNGAGSFAVDTVYLLGGGTAPFWIAAANLDGDADIDLITANQGTNFISILKNNGNATFAAPVNVTVGLRPVYVYPADLDGDGDIDLATADQGTDDFLDSVSLLFNDGAGAFPVRTALQVGSAPTSLVAADLDGDGDRDLAVAVAGTATREDTAVVVFRNSGTGTFAFHQRLLPGAGPNHIVAADFDLDGDVDLVTVDKARSAISFFANDGTGAFAAAQGFGAGIDPRFAAVGDFNGDGDLDLAITNQRSVSVPGQGAFTVLLNQEFVPGVALRGDLNGDRVYNLVDIAQQCNCIFMGTGVCTTALSDVNCDGDLSPVDIILLLQKVFISSAFPC